MGLTKFEYESQKETLEQQGRAIDISILGIKNQIKSNQLEAVTWDLEKSKEDIRKSKLGYETARLQNDINERKKMQLEDALEFEKAMVFLNKQSLLNQGKSALLSLQQAELELEQNTSLFELKYRTSVNLESLPME